VFFRYPYPAFGKKAIAEAGFRYLQINLTLLEDSSYLAENEFRYWANYTGDALNSGSGLPLFARSSLFPGDNGRLPSAIAVSQISRRIPISSMTFLTSCILVTGGGWYTGANRQ
jgi:hypothetical protein